ncbi:hypothetical protein CASFOL_037397 [Castilleja foliolosa]|uniref:Uncharacterized protein n=1 Tax=Castilleja foliolosa TaxID=1961234 RepID=A0ABD3BMQ3_9LAMI
MEAKIGKFFDLVGSIFTGGDQISLCDSDIVAGKERQADLNELNAESQNLLQATTAWLEVKSVGHGSGGREESVGVGSRWFELMGSICKSGNDGVSNLDDDSDRMVADASDRFGVGRAVSGMRVGGWSSTTDQSSNSLRSKSSL